MNVAGAFRTERKTCGQRAHVCRAAILPPIAIQRGRCAKRLLLSVVWLTSDCEWRGEGSLTIHTCCDTHCRRVEQTRRVGGDNSPLKILRDKKVVATEQTPRYVPSRMERVIFPPLAAESLFDDDAWCSKTLLTNIPGRL